MAHNFGGDVDDGETEEAERRRDEQLRELMRELQSADPRMRVMIIEMVKKMLEVYDLKT